MQTETVHNFTVLLCPFVVMLYIASCGAYLANLLKDNVSVGKLATGSLIFSCIVHIAYSALHGIQSGRHPMASMYEIFSSIALSLAIVYLIIEIWRKNRALGVFVLPIVIIFQIIACFGMSPVEPLDPVLQGWYFGVHTGAIALSYAAFFLASIYSILLLWFQRILRIGKFGILFERLPSLNILAKMNRGALLVGMIFFTISLIAGFIWVFDTQIGSIFSPRIIASVLSWTIFGFALFAHYRLKVAHKKTAVFILIGLFFLIASSLAVNLLIPQWHSFGAS